MREGTKHLLDVIEDFTRAYFDKLLLCAILGLLVWIGANSAIEKVKDWAMGQANTVIGAIIMLTTGKVISRLTNGNGKPPEKPLNDIHPKEDGV